MNLTTVWIVLIIAFVVLELITPQLICIWFSVAALFALILELLGVGLWLQILVFVVSSIVLVAISYPLYQKYMKSKIVPTNANALLGEEGVVIIDIDNTQGVGQVKVKGQIWSASAYENTNLYKEDIIKVVEIKGVKLVVKKHRGEEND